MSSPAGNDHSSAVQAVNDGLGSVQVPAKQPHYHGCVDCTLVHPCVCEGGWKVGRVACGAMTAGNR